MKTTQTLPQTSMKMKIVFDEEKIRREGKYDVDKMYASIDKSFEELDIPKVDRGVYQAKGKSKDFSRFMGAILGLSKAEWVMDNISDWLFEDGDRVEDVKYETIKCRRIYG